MTVKTKTEYDENLIKISEPVFLQRKLRNMQKCMAKLQEQIKVYQLSPNLQLA
jgi:hypothetical protein